VCLYRKNIIVFCDGSCSNNGKSNACGGIGIYFPDHPLNEIGMRLSHSKYQDNAKHMQTNNRAEFIAFLEAIDMCIQIDPRKESTIIVYTDSMLLVNTITTWLRSWKKSNYKNGQVKNLDLVKQIDHVMCYVWKPGKIEIYHVKAHTKKTDPLSFGNQMADRLSRKYQIN
jgi:ribonuclease HI